MNTPGNKAAKKGRVEVRPPPGPPAAPPLVKRRVPVALILGGADCLRADVDAALALFAPDLIVATNNAGVDYEGRVDHWVTFHPDKMGEWVRARKKAGRPDAGTLWKPNHRNSPTGLEMRAISSYGGSSGLLACLVVVNALSARGVLAGCPMQVERSHYWDPKKRPWPEAPAYWNAWKSTYPRIKDGIRSMSGKTRELLGAPTLDWINHGQR